MSGESTCTCGRDLALMCRACDADVCDEAEVARLRTTLALIAAVLRQIDDDEDSSAWTAVRDIRGLISTSALNTSEKT